MSTVTVMLDDRSYPVVIRSGCLGNAAELLSEDVDRIVVVTTPRVGGLYFDALEGGLRSLGLDLHRLSVPDGKRAKTMRTASRLHGELADLGADRQTLIIGLGGGAVCDLAGFVASTYMRGTPLIQVPTTLLAHVDASVGGKTAVNHPRGKNLIGTFYQPHLVAIDPDVLASLPARDRRSGMAEVIKHGALWDEGFFSWLEENVQAALELDTEIISETIARSVAIKAEVVSLDEREGGLRALLNFGHTLGHAIESVAGFRGVRHGEAVAMGMAFAAELSERLGLAPKGTAERLISLLDRAGLRTTAPDWSEQKSAYLQAIAVDKKVRSQKVGFVALREIGRAEVVRLSPEEILAGAE